MKRAAVVTCFLLLSCNKPEQPSAPPPPPPIGNAAAGKQHIDKYSCLACHAIPGIEGDGGSLGPDLAGFASRPAINGRIPNKPETVVAYLQNPSAIDPQTTMPPLGITESEAKDITAYLMTLKAQAQAGK
ncbi:MAG TPA: c-type cytochrome [Thermoanaerobaculia bacterium]|nr:c-type cytochrome [Thermoanaerobaculia bacterium]